MNISIQTKVTNKYNTNDSSKQIDGRVTKTGREKIEEWRGKREKGGINWLLLYFTLDGINIFLNVTISAKI